MGYHPGLEDDGIYLTAVKARLNRELYPHDAQFFRLQMQATVFDGFMAHFVRWTRMPLAWAELFWQLAALFLILWASKKILDLLFFQSSARWAGVALVGAMFTLPVSGSALYMADQHHDVVAIEPEPVGQDQPALDAALVLAKAGGVLGDVDAAIRGAAPGRRSGP